MPRKLTDKQAQTLHKQYSRLKQSGYSVATFLRVQASNLSVNQETIRAAAMYKRGYSHLKHVRPKYPEFESMPAIGKKEW